jgi:hypothetical protein
VRIQICGPLAVERDGQRLDTRLPGRQGRLLFTYLVVNRHRQVPRDELAEALWREPDPAAIDTRLNPLPSKLRRVFGADAVDGRSTLRLGLRRARGSISKPRPRPSTGLNPLSPSRTGCERGGRRSPDSS